MNPDSPLWIIYYCDFYIEGILSDGTLLIFLAFYYNYYNYCYDCVQDPDVLTVAVEFKDLLVIELMLVIEVKLVYLDELDDY